MSSAPQEPISVTQLYGFDPVPALLVIAGVASIVVGVIFWFRRKSQ